MVRTVVEGFDNPVARREEDFLERWSFAREVFNIADTTPADWSVRIGVYGEWGAGKSSVMYFIESMALAQKHLVVRFNPWQFSNPADMWGSFIEEVYRVLSTGGVGVKDFAAARNIARLSGLTRRFEWNGGDNPEKSGNPETFSNLQQSGLTVLNQWLLGNANQLARIGPALGQRRILVMVDDLDRTDLSLLPELLYAIRELLDLPRFVFVLCFDPNVVGLALERHHPGWGDGTRFLEKIVDFPRWLPSLTRRDLLALARNDVLRYCTFVNIEALERVFHLLPENPRRLRMFIRSLWSLKSELERYSPQEVDWDVLLLVNLLKFTQPQFAKAFYANTDLMEQLSVLKLAKPDEETRAFQEQSMAQVELTDGPERDYVWSLLTSLSESLYLRDSALLRTHALMTEQPPVLTRREFLAAFEVWQRHQNPDELKSWLDRHKTEREFATKQVVVELYTQAIAFRTECLNRAADAVAEEDFQTGLQEATSALAMLETLAFKLEGFTGSRPLLAAKHFQLTLTMVLKHLPVDDRSHQPLRDQEAAFLEALAQRSVLPPDQFLACLRPWDPSPFSMMRPNQARILVHYLVEQIAPRVAQQLLDMMVIPSSLQPLLTPEARPALRHVLLNGQSPLWQQEPLRARFFELCRRSASEPAIQRNLLTLVDLIIQKLEQDYVRDIEEVVARPEIITAAWTGVLSQPINNRLFLKFKETRDILEDLIGQSLPVPGWWVRMAQDS